MQTDVLRGFHNPVRRWFEQTLGAPTRVQQLAWPIIRSGAHTLVTAPTGSGKTLAAFLVALDDLLFSPSPPRQERCRVLYISPLKALAVDVERNLMRPLEGITEKAQEAGVAVHEVRVAVRTGDTPGRERARFARNPADIFITTPESLFLVLTSQAREVLRTVQWVIVDEIHAVAGSKRGSHLALSLERLVELVAGSGRGEPQRIGLSATVRPLDEVAHFLGGYSDDGNLRPVQIVDAGSRKPLELTVAAPERSGFRSPDEIRGAGGVWPGLQETLLGHIKQHRTTLIFVNNRRTAERLTAALNELAGAEIAKAHHGSLAREQRQQVEEDLKHGRLRALVATSSLELGIDMGTVDLVIQVEAPPSVSSALQRIGRAGHHVDTPSKGLILPKHRIDLLACAAATRLMREGAVEAITYPRNALDVLAQQVTAMVSMDPLTVDGLERIVRRSASYHDLPRNLLEDVLDMLGGRYPSHDFADLRPRLFWNRTDGTLTPREGARRVAVANAGTIPNRGMYSVFLEGVPPTQGRVGELEEIMVFESRVGDVFMLGASSWQIVDITPDRVIVRPAPGRPGRMPFWHGDAPGRPVEFGWAIGSLTRELLHMSPEDALRHLQEQHHLTLGAAQDLMDFLSAQQKAAGVVPDDRTIVVERHRDELGEWRVCLLSPLGSRVLAPWAMAIGAILRERTGLELDVLWTEDGIVFRFPDADSPPPAEWLVLDPEQVEVHVQRQLALGGGAARKANFGAPVTAVFASHFREAAARALLLPQRKPGKRSPLWLTRKRAADLLHIVGRYPDFPIVLETFRECLKDVFDIPALVDVMRRIQEGFLKVVTVDTVAPSPFAASLLFSYSANFMYEGDAPLAERRAHALSFDTVRLRQLLGEADLRELLDGDVLQDTEATLQQMGYRRATSPDDIHDLLLRLGDLTTEEIRLRAAAETNVDELLANLQRAGRIVRTRVAGRDCWIAAEDAARYRDALAAPVPPEVVPQSDRSIVDPLGDLVTRYARTHGPFTAAEVANRFGLGVATVRQTLQRLEGDGRLIEGEFRPLGSGSEWCDREVLATLRRRSLARLRREVEPVDQAAFVRFLLRWHAILRQPTVDPAEASLVAALQRLQGVPLPASQLETLILPARVPAYDPRDLDMLLATGQVFWTGDSRTGPHDGKVRFFMAADAASLRVGHELSMTELTGLPRKIVDCLSDRGAQFFVDIVRSTGGFPGEVLEGLWELTWRGIVTNDTLQPLRSFINPEAARRAEAFARRRAGRYRPLPVGPHIAGRPVPPTALGRWSLVPWVNSPSEGCLSHEDRTGRHLVQAEQLLERYGVVTREAWTTGSDIGNASDLRRVLDEMEQAGRIRRGYFVEGLGATQFALPEAVEMLRACREPQDLDAQPVLLAAQDPANPFGVLLPWPEHADSRPAARSAGSCVFLQEGKAMAWLSATEGRLILFDTNRASWDRTVSVLQEAVRKGKLAPFLLSRVDGQPVEQHPLREILDKLGISLGSRGAAFRRDPIR